MEKPTSNMFPRALLPIHWLTGRDVHWLKVLLCSAKIVKLTSPNFKDICTHGKPHGETETKKESAFTLECYIGFDTPTIQKLIYNTTTTVGEFNTHTCSIIAEYIGSSMFSCSITVRI